MLNISHHIIQLTCTVLIMVIIVFQYRFSLQLITNWNLFMDIPLWSTQRHNGLFFLPSDGIRIVGPHIIEEDISKLSLSLYSLIWHDCSSYNQLAHSKVAQGVLGLPFLSTRPLSAVCEEVYKDRKLSRCAMKLD